MKNLLFVVVACLAGAPAWVLAADPVPADRLLVGGTWSGSIGVSGGIPTSTNIYTTLTSTATASQINTAIANCPSNFVVRLSAGTYNLTGQILLQRDGVILRGDVDANGHPTTIINVGADPAVFLGGNPDTSSTANWNTVTVSSGFTRGSTNVTLASIPSGCAPNGLLWFSAPSGGTVQGGSFGLFCGTDPFVQVVKVSAVSGSQVTFWPPISAPYLTTLKASTPKNFNVNHRMGVENLVLQGSNLTYVRLGGTDQCWVRNVKALNSPSGQVRQVYLCTTYRTEIRHCEFGNINANGSDAYCILGQDCTGTWVEDNYFHNTPNVYPQILAEGNVFSYNYVTNVPYLQTVGWLSQIVYNHGGHCCFNLSEGNVIPTHYDDGMNNNPNDPTSTAYNVFFRENLVGWDGSDGGKIYNCRAITIVDTGTSNTVAGCVLGKTNFPSIYLDQVGNSMNRDIFYLGSSVMSTMGLYGNWNYVDNGVHASEQLSSGQTLANSYIYSSKPSWFGTLAWPPIDPANPARSSSITNIPAGYRAVFGVDPPNSTMAPPTPVGVFSSSLFLATSSTTGTHPLTVQFANNTPTGSSTTVFFGDGTSSTNVGATFSHTYSSQGAYTVSLQQAGGVAITNYGYINVTN